MPSIEARTILVDDNGAEDFAGTVGGKLQHAAGSLTGEAQSMWGQVVDEVRGFTADQPFVALLGAVGLGAVMGFLTVRR